MLADGPRQWPREGAAEHRFASRCYHRTQYHPEDSEKSLWLNRGSVTVPVTVVATLCETLAAQARGGG